ncbi:MAG: hypothetical protein AAGA54_32695 [Myxococcota bacterium]
MSRLVAASILVLLASCDASTEPSADESGSAETTGTPSTAADDPDDPSAMTTDPDDPSDGPGTSSTPDASSTGGADESSTGTPIDLCADVICDEPQVCLEGVCVEPEDLPPPPPTFSDPSAGCPEGTVNANDLTDPMRPLNLCVPACDLTAGTIFDACPQPESGTAVAACLFGPDENGGTCDNYGDACETEGQWCIRPLLQTHLCIVADLCVLDCSDERSCPDGMSCSDGLCEFTAG